MLQLTVKELQEHFGKENFYLKGTSLDVTYTKLKKEKGKTQTFDVEYTLRTNDVILIASQCENATKAGANALICSHVAVELMSRGAYLLHHTKSNQDGVKKDSPEGNVQGPVATG
jgi:hypothetical protein